MSQAKSRATTIDQPLLSTDDLVGPGGPALSTVPATPGAPAEPVVVRRGTIIRIPLIDRLVPLLRLQMGLALIVLNLADVILTKVLLGAGAIEANPVMAPIMAGTVAPIGAKTLVPAFAATLLIMCPPESRLADRAVATVLGVYVGIVLWNSALLAHLSL